MTRAEWEPLVTSQLTAVECRRTIDRLRLTGFYDGEAVQQALASLAMVESRMLFVDVTPEVLTRASGSFGNSIIRTLDAAHLATAILIRTDVDPQVLFLTHDRQQAAAAQSMGFHVFGAETTPDPEPI